MREFLVEMEINVPPEVDPAQLAALKQAEAARAAELGRNGSLYRIWRPTDPGWRNLGIWRAEDQPSLEALIDSLPLRPFMSITIRPLVAHPADPG